MFSGIISALGRVLECRSVSGGTRFTLQAPTAFLQDLQSGASIAVNGACQTVEALTDKDVCFFSSRETLSRSNLGGLRPAAVVNLEQSLTLGSALDGHLVTGHVDACAPLVLIEAAGASWNLGVEIPEQLLPFVAEKGSLAVDGISLTVNRLQKKRAMLTVVPHTWQHTNLQLRKTGELVNLEVDILARYVARFLAREKEKNAPGLEETLLRSGFRSDRGGHDVG